MKEYIEGKSLIDMFIERIKSILNLSNFRNTTDNMIAEQYNDALEKIEKQLDLGINIIPKPNDLNFLQNYVSQNIKDAGDDISNQLRQEIQRGILNKETTKQLAARVRLLFKEKKYQTRLKTILRTETLRANNMGTLEGAKQASETGLKLLKWLDVTEDARTSKICLLEHQKYGSPDKAIPLDKEFIVKVDNKTYRSQAPPFHPNCRTVLMIRRVE